MRSWYPLILTLVVGAYLQGCGTSSQWQRGNVTGLPVQHAKPRAAVIPSERPFPAPDSVGANAESASGTIDDSVVAPMRLISKPESAVQVRPVIQPRPAIGSSTKAKWVPLDYWATSQGFGNLQRVSTNQFHLVTHWGVFGLAARARYAIFNGWQFYLGYPLRMTNGMPLINVLDAEKNFLPLAGSYQPIPKTRGIICIDAGHGGKHNGTKSTLGGFFEKNYALDWALRIHPLLQAKGWQVVMTRTNDVTMSIDQRVAVADRYGADLFISLHFNAAGKGASGLETYCTTPQGMPSTLTRGYSDPMSGIMPNNAYDNRNVHLAGRIHNAMIKNVGMADRGVRRARFMSVIAKQKRPAVLVEGGYLSDPAEARLIGTAAYRQKLAEAIAKAL